MTYIVKRPDGDTKWWETSHDEEKLKHTPAHDADDEERGDDVYSKIDSSNDEPTKNNLVRQE